MNNLYKCDHKYSCAICEYSTNKSSEYKKHINTQKHLSKEILGVHEPKISDKPRAYTCKICNKTYKARNGLWYHSQKGCSSSEQIACNTTDKDELIIMILKQNSEMLKENCELRKEHSDLKDLILEIVKNGTNNTINHNIVTNTNSHNKAFNLNFFLNETCKNAMNITDFVDSIKLQLADFINVGEVGFVEGISNIIVKNLNSLDENMRPIHCTDQKREIFYVKDENMWEKDDDKRKMNKLIKSVAYKNEKLMKTYKEMYPDYNDPDSHRSDQYSKTVIEAMDCKEESREKIIKKISKVTIISSK